MPKKTPAAVNTQIVIVTASSLVVIIFGSSYESEWLFLQLHDILLNTLTQVKLDAGTSAVILCDKKGGHQAAFLGSWYIQPLQRTLHDQ
jgi:hypothetical protein